MQEEADAVVERKRAVRASEGGAAQGHGIEGGSGDGDAIVTEVDAGAGAYEECLDDDIRRRRVEEEGDESLAAVVEGRATPCIHAGPQEAAAGDVEQLLFRSCTGAVALCC